MGILGKMFEAAAGNVTYCHGPKVKTASNFESHIARSFTITDFGGMFIIWIFGYIPYFF